MRRQDPRWARLGGEGRARQGALPDAWRAEHRSENRGRAPKAARSFCAAARAIRAPSARAHTRLGVTLRRRRSTPTRQMPNPHRTPARPQGYHSPPHTTTQKPGSTSSRLSTCISVRPDRPLSVTSLPKPRRAGGWIDARLAQMHAHNRGFRGEKHAFYNAVAKKAIIRTF